MKMKNYDIMTLLRAKTRAEMAYKSVVTEHADDFIQNLSRLHTTPMGVERIRKNLQLEADNVVEWCRTRILEHNALIERAGKNWYITTENYMITVNAHSYTIITAHML